MQRQGMGMMQGGRHQQEHVQQQLDQQFMQQYMQQQHNLQQQQQQQHHHHQQQQQGAPAQYGGKRCSAAALCICAKTLPKEAPQPSGRHGHTSCACKRQLGSGAGFRVWVW